MKLYGIWCFDAKDNKGDWLRAEDGEALSVYQSKQRACDRARERYGFDTYTEAKRKRWVEVRRLA